MKKIFLLVVFTFLAGYAIGQDEYEEPVQPTTPVEEEIPTSTDSISIQNEPETTEETIGNIYPRRESEFRRNFRLGGGFNLSSTYYNSPAYQGQLLIAGLSPQFTYVLSDYFEGGLALSYNYLGSFGDLNVHSYSFGPILRAYPFESVFLQLQGIFFQNQTIFRGQTEKAQDINAYVGGGIISRFSEKAYVVTGIQVNLIKNAFTYNQIYPVPFTSFHFGF